MTELEKLLYALDNFEPTVELDALRVGPEIVEKAVEDNPKLAYYIMGMTGATTFRGRPRLVLNFTYENTNIPRSEIHVISSGEEFQSLFTQYIGNYKKRLVMIVDDDLNVQAEFEKFNTVSAAFFPNYVGVTYNSMKSPFTNMPIYDFAFKYRIGRVKLEMMENEMDAEVERLARMMFLPGMNAETKALLAHNYLAKTITYTLNENASNLERSYLQSAYGALITKKCVCQGYAEAFKRLMDYTGVPCEIICGQIKDSDEHHAWNIIKLNNGRENYHIDVTWDSHDGRIYYDYFGLRDSDLADNRTWNYRYNPRCISSRNILLEGKRGIMQFRSRLIANGVSTKFLG